MQTLIQDLRYGVRRLVKAPGFAFVAVFTITLGIAANSVIFSVINALLFRPLPYTDPARLVMLWERNPQIQIGFDLLPVSAANFIDWRHQSKSFEEISVLDSVRFVLTGGDRPERVSGASVSYNFFKLMGIEPFKGRAFLPEEDKPGANQVVIISHGLWQSRYGSDPNIINRTILLDGKSYTVVGIMPSGFQFPHKDELPLYFRLPPQTEIWTPIGITDEQLSSRTSLDKAVIARLKPGVTLDQAQAEMNMIARRLEEQYPDNKGFGVTITTLQEQVVGKMRGILFILLAAVGFVLLIVCVNVANLLLARSMARQKEIAIRVALGANRSRIVRQLLTESVLLSVIGGVLAIVVATLAMKFLLAFSPDSIPRKSEIKIDWLVLLFTLLVSFFTGILFGIIPALETARVNLNDLLKEGSTSSVLGLGHNRIRGLLVVSEVALSIVLLIGAGLMFKSFLNIISVDPGFQPQNVLTMSLNLPENKYSSRRQQIAFFKEVLGRMRSMPGVMAASAVTDLPLSGAEEVIGFTIEGHPAPATQAETPLADHRDVDYNYFETLRIALVSGRYFDEGDNEKASKVAIIGETLAGRFFPDESPLGKRIKIEDPDGNSPWFSIVGVVKDVKNSALQGPSRPQIYFPYLQSSLPRLTLVVRTASNWTDMAGLMRNEVWAVDKDQPISNTETMQLYLSDSVSQDRLIMILLNGFAAIAVILAALGIYGLMSGAVMQRRHEIAIRMALGAQPGHLLKMVIKQGMILALLGLAIGLVAATALTRVMASLLFGISPTDPGTFVILSVLLTAVALLATFIPARRATKVDPAVALKYQ